MSDQMKENKWKEAYAEARRAEDWSATFQKHVADYNKQLRSLEIQKVCALIERGTPEEIAQAHDLLLKITDGDKE